MHNLLIFNDCKQNSNLLGHDLWDAHFRKLMSVELQFYRQKINTIFKQTKLIEGCNTCFPKSSNWELAKCIDNKRSICKKHRTMRNFDNHLSAQSASNSNPSSLGMKKASKRKGGCSQTKSKIVSNLSCAVYALNTISIW